MKNICFLIVEMTLRWGIVSAGKICHDFVNAFHSYPDVGDQVIAAVAARDKSRAVEFAKLHNIAKVFDSYQAMAESNDIDVAYVGVLNMDHYNVARLFLENRKHVLCEKPLCLNLKQTQSLVNLSKKNKLFLMEAVWSRFSPAYIALQKEIQAGTLGDLKHVDVTFGVPIETVDRLRKKELGGSAIMDIGIYAFQFAQFCFKDEPIKVTATGKLNEFGVDILDTVILEYEGDRRAVLNVDLRVKLWNKATVAGTKANATVEEPFQFPHEMIVDGKKYEFPLHASDKPYYFLNSAGLVYEALEVVRCIKQGLTESPLMSHRESLIISKLEDTVRKQVGVHYDVDDQDYP